MPAALPPLRWDIFCQVIDNFGDIGVCWRLACALAQRGDTVRLRVDDQAVAMMVEKYRRLCQIWDAARAKKDIAA